MTKHEKSLKIGISACLLGQEVRYDGGHKRDRFLVDVLGAYVEWMPVCPEVEIGLGIPRDTLRLVRQDGDVRMIMTKTGEDHTQAMRAYARKRLTELSQEDLCGYVLKRDSPSCGMERVRVYGESSSPSKTGRGLFAEALLDRFPNLPIEEEGRLCDPHLRENFIERIFAYRRVKELFTGRWKMGDIVAFHTAHKLQLLAHSTKAYSELGRLVAGAKPLPRDEFRKEYETRFMAALTSIATNKRNTNVLQHMFGYFSRQLDEPSRAELLNLIEDYRQEMLPIVVPLTLIRHYVRLFNVEYLKGQTYLEPHPKELMLRNHV